TTGTWSWGAAPSVRDAKGRRGCGVLHSSSLAGGPAVLKDQVIHIPAAGYVVFCHLISSFAHWVLGQYMPAPAENCTDSCTCRGNFFRQDLAKDFQMFLPPMLDKWYGI